MARYSTTISSALAPADAFAYMADFSNARFWDPSVSEGARKDDGPIGLGSAFEIVARFAGRDVPLTYAIVAYEPPVKVVLEARRGFVSRDTITVEEAAGGGSRVHYDAVLAFTRHHAASSIRSCSSSSAAWARRRRRDSRRLSTPDPRGEAGRRTPAPPVGSGVATSAGSAPCR